MSGRAGGNFTEELIATARKIATPGKGILAADESTGTIGNRFSGIGVENTEENRQFYRDLLITAPGMNEYISGIIMFEETLFQNSVSGRPFVEILNENGVVPGIKIDKGLKIIPGTKGENSTEGLDGLADRCARYYAQGARFSKWRAVLKIDVAQGLPSQTSILENAWTLARQACISQENGLVPIVEPEILVDGSHDIETSARVTETVLAACVKALQDQNVLWEGCMLKPNMVTPGSLAPKVDPRTVAWFTYRTLSRTIPPALPTINFLSGGQSEEEATLNLNELNKLDVPRPWQLSFSYGRALQSSALKAWVGVAENKEAAQNAFLAVARANSQARFGTYAGGALESASLFVANYSY